MHDTTQIKTEHIFSTPSGCLVLPFRSVFPTETSTVTVSVRTVHVSPVLTCKVATLVYNVVRKSTLCTLDLHQSTFISNFTVYKTCKNLTPA